MRRTLALIVSLLVLAPVAPAQAKWFAARPIDGPAGIDALGVSLGRDGTGAVVYAKRDGDNPAGYLSRLRAGVWQAPQRLPADGVTEIAAAAGERGRLALAWIAGGLTYGAVVDRAGRPVSAPVPLGSASGASGLDVRIGVQGGAVAVWAEAGAGGSDVRAAQLLGSTWTAVPAPLDIDPAHAAGAGAGRPRVAVAADDTAVVAWGEVLGDGLSHVFYRRLLGTTLSQYPQEASVPGFAGAAAGSADSPEIDVEFDRSFAWVAFRQDVGGASRSLVRRLRGSTFDEAIAIDAGVPSGAPALSMTSTGEGMTVAPLADGSLRGTRFADDVLTPTGRLDRTASAAPSTPVAWVSDRSDGAVAYRTQAADGSAVARGRTVSLGHRPGAETVISSAAAGPVAPGSLRIAGDRVGDVAVAMLQGAPGARSLTVALRDIPPARPVISSRSRHLRPGRRIVAWTAGLDYLGPQRFRVQLDGRTIGTTTKTRLRTRRLRVGRHRLRVTAIDRRGQRATSRTATVIVRR